MDHHVVLGHPGYLIHAEMKSIAPDVLFTRLLAHHDEVGLSPEQVLTLLDIGREYHAEQARLRVAFAKVSERLEIKWGRVDSTEVARRGELLDEHARLFRAAEALFFEYARRGHELLTDEQIEAAEAVYHAEKNDGLTQLAAAIDNAVAPAYRFRPAVETADEASRGSTALVA